MLDGAETIITHVRFFYWRNEQVINSEKPEDNMNGVIICLVEAILHGVTAIGLTVFVL